MLELVHALDNLKGRQTHVEYQTDYPFIKKHYNNCIYPNNFFKVVDFISESHLIRFNKRLEEISSLSEDWDGYGAYAPFPEIIVTAQKFLKSLDVRFLNTLSEYSIFPNPNGTISIEWENGNNIISLELGKHTANYFAKINDQYFKEENIKDISRHVPSRLYYALTKL